MAKSGQKIACLCNCRRLALIYCKGFPHSPPHPSHSELVVQSIWNFECVGEIPWIDHNCTGVDILSDRRSINLPSWNGTSTGTVFVCTFLLKTRSVVERKIEMQMVHVVRKMDAGPSYWKNQAASHIQDLGPGSFLVIKGPFWKSLVSSVASKQKDHHMI